MGNCCSGPKPLTDGQNEGSRYGQHVQQWQQAYLESPQNGQATTSDIHVSVQGNSCEERNALEILRQENESLKVTIHKLKNESDSEITKARDDMRKKFKEAMSKKEMEVKILQEKTDRIYQETIQEKNRQIEKFQQDLNKIQKERDNLLTRYSALAGSKLTDGNANIADLSDENRPTKLAEQYAELYDNEWTDAFAVLTADETRTNGGVCHILAKAFCIIYSTARQEAQRNLAKLTKTIKLFLKVDELPLEVLKTIKDRRKKEPGRYLDRIRKLYSDDIGKILSPEEQKHVSQFLKKSIDLCWLMAIQDPPLYVDTNLSRVDEEFDTNHFKPYTATGKFIDFVVWPTLYLFEEGNMLCKGIAQGKKVRREKQPYDNVEINRGAAKNSNGFKSSTLSSTNPVSFVQTTKHNITSISVGKHESENKRENDYAVVTQSQGKPGSSVGRKSQDLNCSQNAGENISPRDEGIKDTMSVPREHESASTPGQATTYEANSRPKSYASVSHSATTKPTTMTLKEWTWTSTETKR